MTRVLVTGGAGFIGSHLVDALLADGAERVAVVDTMFLGRTANLADAMATAGDRVVLHREDAAEAEALAGVIERERPDVVYNLATKALGYSFLNPVGAYRVNTDIALNLCELLRQGRFSRLVHVSSSEVYGTARTVPMDEDHPLGAETTYAAGKAGADLAVASFIRMFDLDATIVRPFNNLGPRQNAGHLAAVIPLTVRRIQLGQAPSIDGDGDQTRDFIHVADTVRILRQIAAHPDAAGAVVNVGSGVETSIGWLVRRVAELMDYDGPIDMRPARPADVRRHCADITRLRSILPEVSITPLSEALPSTIAWYREQTER